MPYKYKIDENFFKKWTPQMAYVLGWIYSDGTLRKNRYQFKISTNDKNVLKNIIKFLQSSHQIYQRNDPRRKLPTFELVIDSKKIFIDLLKIGLTPQKSKRITFPSIPKKYFFHFFRGYFDGDGSVYIDTPSPKYKNIKRLYFRIHSGSSEFLKSCQKLLTKNLKLKPKNLIDDNQRGFVIGYSTKESLIIMKNIYKKTSRENRLERKYEVYQNYLSYLKSKTTNLARKIKK